MKTWDNELDLYLFAMCVKSFWVIKYWLNKLSHNVKNWKHKRISIFLGFYSGLFLDSAL